MSSKTILTEDGEIEIAVPRDRAGSFEQQLIAKGQSRFDGFDDKILSLYARGMTVREIQGSLAELYGAEVSPDLIRRVTDAILEEVRDWRSRPLDAVYPIVFVDALRVKIRDEGVVKKQGRLHRTRLQCRWREGRPGALDRADRGRHVLAAGRQRAQGARRHHDCRRRRTEGLPRGDHVGLPANAGADLHRALDQEQPWLRLPEGSQSDPAFDEVSGRERRYGAGALEEFEAEWAKH